MTPVTAQETAQGKGQESTTVNNSNRSELLAVTFTSAWCASCKILNPRLKQVTTAFESHSVEFITLDFTFGNRNGTRQLAKQHNFTEVYERYSYSTGFTLLIDKDTNAIIDTLTVQHTVMAMKQALSAALAIAATTPAPIVNNQ